MRAHGKHLRQFAILAVLAVTAALLPVMALSAPAQAASGDFSLDLTAAAPYSYNHLVGGGAYDDRTVGVDKDVVESLEGGDFKCGDIVTFLTQVSVDDTAQAATDGPQTIDIGYQFLMDSTGQSGAALGDITSVGVNYGSVVDTIPGELPGDQGISDNGDSTATLTSETTTGPMFQSGSTLNGTVRLTGLERAEKVVVRVDVRIFCKPGSSPTGNLQANLSGAQLVLVQGNVPASGSISAGAQTVPFKQIGNLGIPALAIAKTVTTANGTCPGTESLAIQSGTTVKYCYNVTNPGSAPLYDLTSVTDDNRTPADTSDDFAVALTGLTDVDGDGQNDDLAAGGQAVGEKLVTITAGQTGTYTNTAQVTGYQFPGDTSLPFTASDTASVIVTVPVGPSINVAKTAGVLSGPDAQGDYTVSYTVTVTNSGSAVGTYGPITDSPGFDSNLTATSVSWKRVADSTWTTDSAAPYLVGTAGTAIAGGATDTYDVEVTFQSTGTGTASACDGTAGHGLYNSVAVPNGQEQGTAADNSACVEPPGVPSINLAKTAGVLVGPDAQGDYTVSYTVTLTNSGSAAGTYGPITDTPQFDTNLTAASLSWKGAADSTWTTDAAAPYLIGAAGTTIAAGTTDTYDVKVTFHYSGTGVASACNGTADHGLYNSVSVPDGQEQGSLADNHACVEPPTPGQASVWIEKTADFTHAAPGDLVTYKLVVHNTGTAPATGVTVKDALPSGVTFQSATNPPCTESSGTVTCDVVGLAAGESKTMTITVKVDALPSSGSTSHQHQLGYTKVEANLSVFDGIGTATAECPSGYFATDGSVRIDHVDQGSGTLADVIVLASHATADGSGWTGTIRNDTLGQAQVKVNVVCMSKTTVSGDDHTHAVDVSAPKTTSASFTAGRHQVDLTCPSGSYPVTPGFTFTSGDGVVSTKLTGSGWTFFVDTTGTATANFEIRCLSDDLGQAAGHTHHLTFKQVTGTLTVPAGQTAEAKLTCPDGYKGIVAWYDIDPGLVPLGTDPQPISRVFQFYNATGSDLQARIGLLCAPILTDGGDDGGPVTITNTATVTTTSPDADASDNSDSAIIQVTATGVASATSATVSGSGHRAMVTFAVLASGSRTVSFKLVAIGKVRGTHLKAGSVLATTKASVRRGHNKVRLAASGAAADALRAGKIHVARLVVVARDGSRDVRVVRLRH